MDDKDNVLVLSIDVGKLNGNWSIKARTSEGCVASAGTMGWVYPQLSENQVRLLASYLVHSADDWMKGTRDWGEK